MTAVFIGGTGRSGTNITRKILAQSPDVASPHFETRYTVDPYGVMPVLRSFDDQTSPFAIDELLRKHFLFLRLLARKNPIQSAVNKVLRMIPGNKKELLVTGFSYADWNLEAHFPGYGERLDKYLEAFSSSTYFATRPGYTPFSLKPKMIYLGRLETDELFRAAKTFVCGNIDAAKGVNQTKFYVEDNTYNLLYASTIDKLVHGAKFIHVRRDPLDIVASYLGQRWCPGSAPMAAKIIADLLVTIEKELKSVPAESVITFTLEGLVEDSATQIQHLCDFLNLNFDQNMKDIDLTRSNTGRSRQEFSSSELDELNSILDEHIESFNIMRKNGL